MSKAAEAAEEKKVGIGEEVILSTGVRAIIRPVSILLMQNAQRKIKDPPVPIVKDPDKDGEEVENQWDPDYIKACKDAEDDRAEVAIDIAIIMGLRLLDGIPPDEEWLDDLNYMIGRDMVDISAYDLSNPKDKELVYKKFLATGNKDWDLMTRISGLTTDEGVQAQMESFPSDEVRGEDMGDTPPSSS